MKSMLSILVVSLMAAPVFAMDMSSGIGALPMGDQVTASKQAGPKRPKCNLKFSTDQKTAYKQVREMFMKDTQALRQRLKKVRKNYRKVLHNTNAKVERADKLAARLVKMSSKVRSARTDLFHTIAYDIATADQRKPLLKCMRKMRRYRMKMKLKKKKAHKPKPKA